MTLKVYDFHLSKLVICKNCISIFDCAFSTLWNDVYFGLIRSSWNVELYQRMIRTFYNFG